MSDTPSPAEQTPAPTPGQAQEVEVDLAAFLPEGVSLEGADEGDTEGEIEIEIVAETEAQPVPAAEPAVDTEALAQIERDLDAVDAAIAALDAGTYGTDSATGQPIADALLAEDPTRLTS